MKYNYGVMQGRLSEIVENKIQAFPNKNWKSEFSKANKLGLKSIEWTLDYKNLENNPIFSNKGRLKIKELSKKYSIKINSLTGDCFMQKPFWKTKNNQKLIADLKKIINSCKVLGIRFIVIPLVDNGSIKNHKHRNNLIKSCKKIIKYLQNSKIKLIFESDFSPKKLKGFIKKFDKNFFGINYDVGNSAALNYNIDEEFKCYGNYIFNIHIKDRFKNGKTIRLGNGGVNFFKLFCNLRKIKYKNNLILQTARSKNKQHMKEIKVNLAYLEQFHNV
jgi:L-ribulose-5-phosphate 3-epimerase